MIETLRVPAKVSGTHVCILRQLELLVVAWVASLRDDEAVVVGTGARQLLRLSVDFHKGLATALAEVLRPRVGILRRSVVARWVDASQSSAELCLIHAWFGRRALKLAAHVSALTLLFRNINEGLDVVGSRLSPAFVRSQFTHEAFLVNRVRQTELMSLAATPVLLERAMQVVGARRRSVTLLSADPMSGRLWSNAEAWRSLLIHHGHAH